VGKIFGFKRHGEIGDWRIFRNEEVQDFQSSPIFFRVITYRVIIYRECGTCVENLNVYRILVGKTERSIGRPRDRFKNNIKIYLKGIGWDGFMWLRTRTSGQFI
jgi:hypothetical protein